MLRFNELVHASRRPKHAVAVNRSTNPTHAPDHELVGGRSERFLGTLLNRRRRGHVKASRRTFLKGAITSASAGAAATATVLGPARSLGAQVSVPVRGQYPKKILAGCDPLHSTHDCRPGCGETPTCNHLGCCDSEGWFRNAPANGFQPLDTSYCSVVGAPVFGDGWLWEYFPDLDGADAGGPCAHCKRLVFRCHDGAVYRAASGTWEPMICRAEIECDPTDLYDRLGSPPPEPTAVPPTPAPIPTPAPLDLQGELEALLDDGNGEVTVSGWAFATDGGELEMVIEAGSSTVTVVPSLPRRDVERRNSGAGCCTGFVAVLSEVPEGRQIITLSGRRGDRTTVLATADLEVRAATPIGDRPSAPASPGVPAPISDGSSDRSVGGLDTLAQGRLGGAFASGWAGDVESTLGPFVVATVDGDEVASTRPTLPRSDVDVDYPGFGPSTGWSLTIPYDKTKTAQVCIHLVDPHDGARRLLGCRTIAAPETVGDVPISQLAAGPRAEGVAAAPQGASSIVGAVEAATSAAAGRVTVRGWACDQAAPEQSLRVRVTAGSEDQVTVETSLQRDDISAALGSPGAHGWLATLPADPGRALVEAVVVDDRDDVVAHLGLMELVVR